MSVLYQALKPLPTDNVLSPTAMEQDEVEQEIVALLDDYQVRGRSAAAAKRGDSTFDDVENARSTLIALDSLADGDVPVTPLNRALHRAFLLKILGKPLPSQFLAFDSSRCWMIFWIAQSLALMGFKLDESARTQALSTLLHFQNNTLRSAKSSIGGFGSGHGQISHLMGTYATVMALALLGGPGPAPSDDDVAQGLSISIGKGGWDAIDRPRLYDLLLSLKQPDGSFTVHESGEIDVRSIYCVLCISLMLGIATPKLLDGVGEAIANCQSYEGGLSAASYPLQMGDAKGLGGAAMGEAHGGYVYCAMAAHLCLALLPDTKRPGTSPFQDEHQNSTSGAGNAVLQWNEKDSASSYRLDLDDVIRWASAQQGLPGEGGGFRGRTNKLVDGCYGWFSGAGLGTVLSALTELKHGQWWKELEDGVALSTSPSDGRSEGWESVEEAANQYDGFLFDRRALQEYILEIAQDSTTGGLRDKPGKRCDAYHTCYNLSGLSLCQYRVHLDANTRAAMWQAWRSLPEASNLNGDASGNIDSWRRACYMGMMSWTIDPKQTLVLGAPSNRLNITHPIFNVPFLTAKGILDWAYAQEVPV